MVCVDPVGLWGLSRFLTWLRDVFTKLQEASWAHREHFVARPNTLRQLIEASQFSAHEGMFRNMPRCFWLPLIGWFGVPLDADVTSLNERAKWRWYWPWHTAAHHFYLALPLLSFDVGHECKINWLPTNLSACRRYTRDRGTPPIQVHKLTETHIIGKLFDWPRLLCCFCRLSWCISWTRLRQTSERFTSNFPVVSLYIACLLALVVSTTTAATFT